MADDVVLPGTGMTIATRERDLGDGLVHLQMTIPTGEFFSASVGLGGELVLDDAGYLAGEVLLDGPAATDLAPGVYRMVRSLAATTEGTMLPAGFTVALVPHASATPPTWPEAHDAYTPTLVGGLGVEALLTTYITEFTEVYDGSTLRGSHAPVYLNVLEDPAMDSVRVIFFTTDAIPSFAVGELLLLSLTLERLGPSVS